MRKIIFALCIFLLSAAGLDIRSHAQTTAPSLSCTPPVADPEISALARALNYNLPQIYEYVYYNIETSHTFGSKKGALGTFLDKRGNNFDQNVLFVTLLRQSCLTANYRYGTVTLTGADMASVLGVKNDADVFARSLGNGGIPACIRIAEGGACVTTGGAAVTVRTNRVWTEVVADGETVRLDPSLKSLSVSQPIDVKAAMAYNQATFNTRARSGSSAVSGLPAGTNSIKSLSKTNITADLNKYADALASHIRKNLGDKSAKEIYGGRTITNTLFGAKLPGEWLTLHEFGLLHAIRRGNANQLRDGLHGRNIQQPVRYKPDRYNDTLRT